MENVLFSKVFRYYALGRTSRIKQKMSPLWVPHDPHHPSPGVTYVVAPDEKQEYKVIGAGRGEFFWSAEKVRVKQEVKDLRYLSKSPGIGRIWQNQ